MSAANMSIPEDPAVAALREADRTLQQSTVRAVPIEMAIALIQVAHASKALGMLDNTEAQLEAALRWARAAGSTDLVVDLLGDLCAAAACIAERQEVERSGSGHAARERARDHAFEASSLAARVADCRWEATVLLRISDVLDRCGDRDDAVLLQTRALRLMAGSPASNAPDPSLLPSLGRLADG